MLLALHIDILVDTLGVPKLVNLSGIISTLHVEVYSILPL